MKRSIMFIALPILLLTGCNDVQQGVEQAQQVIQTGQQVLETGKQVVETGKEIANSEIAQQLQSYLQQKYEASESLRQAMFSGDGHLLTEELKNTELANFSFYRSDLLGLEFTGKLTADGTFQVLKHDLSNPDVQPTIVKEFNVFLNQSGQIEVN
ncbi:hypothetical protein [Brevibacillus fulvus]|uniref:Uncharacterized protein YcfL n=1 Tax=Brevibacillus fulvus TaxID=1125967 RepID=A0A938Y317_9BACL|nr:hypothetical protein [Brevibacillus fulvus]MBM7590712.1 uncharacterized protein YcfL [Brevibacillus fulvus]